MCYLLHNAFNWNTTVSTMYRFGARLPACRVEWFTTLILQNYTTQRVGVKILYARQDLSVERQNSNRSRYKRQTPTEDACQSLLDLMHRWFNVYHQFPTKLASLHDFFILSSFHAPAYRSNSNDFYICILFSRDVLAVWSFEKKNEEREQTRFVTGNSLQFKARLCRRGKRPV